VNKVFRVILYVIPLSDNCFLQEIFYLEKQLRYPVIAKANEQNPLSKIEIKQK